jgi:hypothetical protein
MNNLSVLAIAAVSLLRADSATADIGLPSAPTLPPVPTVTVTVTAPKVLDPVISATPSLPQLPPVPSVPQLPSAPQLPGTSPSTSVPNVSGGSTLPSVSTRTPSTSHSGASAPSSGSSSGGSGATSTGGSGATSTGSGATSAGGSGGGTSSGARDGAAAGTPAARRHASVRRARGERRLRKTVDRLQGCLGGLGRLERRVLVLRAGLGAGPPRTRSRVARRLDLSTRRVTRLEHRGVRALRKLAGAGRCGSRSAPGAAEDSTTTAAGGGLQGVSGSSLSADHASTDRTAVRGEREASGDERSGGSARTTRQGLGVLPQTRVLGVDLTPPLLIALSLGILGFAIRGHRRQSMPPSA